MNHKERIKVVLAGGRPDRLPVSTWGHDFLREGTAEDLAAQTIERQRKFDYDFVKLNPRWTMFAEPWGNRYQPPTEQKFPRLVHKVVASADDLRSIPVASPQHPVFKEHVRALALVVDAIGDSVDILVTVFSPLAVAGLLAGGVGEPLVTYAREKPEDLKHALEHISETLAQHVEDLIGTGASGIFYAHTQWTSLDVCDDAFFEAFGRPYDRPVLAAATAPFNMLHVCGNNTALERYFDYPVQVINWDNFGPGNMSLREAAARTEQIVAGGIPHRRIHKMNVGELTRAAADSIGGIESRLMLAGGCAVGALVGDEMRHAAAALPDTLIDRG